MTNANDCNQMGLGCLLDPRGCLVSKGEEVTLDLVVSKSFRVQVYFVPKLPLVSSNTVHMKGNRRCAVYVGRCGFSVSFASPPQ